MLLSYGQGRNWFQKVGGTMGWGGEQSKSVQLGSVRGGRGAVSFAAKEKKEKEKCTKSRQTPHTVLQKVSPKTLRTPFMRKRF